MDLLVNAFFTLDQTFVLSEQNRHCYACILADRGGITVLSFVDFFSEVVREFTKSLCLGLDI